ncbi:lipase family protein [Rhodococcus sp. TAF43]|uniref:lipase family protein n=1 Tax=unclassified Rhodococcus (in: high G+C Gram-positive bacteria) TaxID=192944 RepID=UPI001581621D|nr:lipase family protein [Rhodococcus sp. W8901]QKT12448.1 lipase [Rhodococcus sp. W8901]
MSSFARRLMSAATLAIAAVVVGTLASPASAGAEPAYPTPYSDPFYAAPPDIASKAPGDVLESRRADTWILPGTEVWQIKYRSTNSAGRPIPAVTTVIKPVGAPADMPVLSYQAIVNSLGLRCAPSAALFTGEIKDAFGIPLALAMGWALAIPDHLGPDSAYGAAKLGGMITLDGVRAVKHLPELRLGGSPVALAGYSGGGMATAWAAALNPTYAPDVKLAGVAQGGVPASIEEMAVGLGLADRHPGFGLGFAAAVGLEREYPDRLPLGSQLSPAGIALRDELKDECRTLIIAKGLLHSVSEVAKSTSLIQDEDVRAVMRENSLVDFPGVPTAPVFMWHGASDELTPFRSVAATADRYCKAGATLEFHAYPIAEHMTNAVVGLPEAFMYLKDRFAGLPAPSNC